MNLVQQKLRHSHLSEFNWSCLLIKLLKMYVYIWECKLPSLLMSLRRPIDKDKTEVYVLNLIAFTVAWYLPLFTWFQASAAK